MIMSWIDRNWIWVVLACTVCLFASDDIQQTATADVRSVSTGTSRPIVNPISAGRLTSVARRSFNFYFGHSTSDLSLDIAHTGTEPSMNDEPMVIVRESNAPIARGSGNGFELEELIPKRLSTIPHSLLEIAFDQNHDMIR